MLRVFIALILIARMFPAAAQPFTLQPGSGVETNIVYGRIIKHTSKILGPVPDVSTAADINFVQQTYGTKDWQQRRHFPLYGIAFAYTNYGIDSIYGKCFSVYPNLQIPVIRGKKIEWTLKAGFGLGYLTKRYERMPSWDTLNTAIGSRFNNYSYFATDVRYHINRHWDVQLGLNFSHASNASFRQPNLGLNMYGAHAGIRYFPVTSSPEHIVRDIPKLKNRWLFQARAGISGAELSAADGPVYPIYLATVYASKRYLSKNKLLAGVDYSYHEHIYAFLRNNEIEIGHEKNASWKSSVFIGNEFLYGRFGIIFQVGFYLKQAYLKQDAYYEKLGANLYLLQREKGFLKELYTCALLKTHKTQAELVEIGIGVGF